MKKVLLMAALVALVASPTMAGMITATATSLDGAGGSPRVTQGIEYSAIPSPYAAYAAATGVVGWDDYTSSPDAAGSYDLDQMRFVGGVTALPTADSNVQFDFFNPDLTWANGFTLALPQAGNFIWNITGISLDAPFSIPGTGIIQMTVLTGFTGQFYLTSTAPTVGTSAPGYGAPAGYWHAFELTSLPEPGSLMLLGLGLVGLIRRR